MSNFQYVCSPRYALKTRAQDGAASRQQERELIVARTFDYEGEAACDGHMRTFLKCIQAAAAADGQGFAAIKVRAPPAAAMLCHCRKTEPDGNHLALRAHASLKSVYQLLLHCLQSQQVSAATATA